MKRLFVWLSWILKGKPMITYPGFNCGCCGKWHSIPFSVPAYKANEWWDTWGICLNGCEDKEVVE